MYIWYITFIAMPGLGYMKYVMAGENSANFTKNKCMHNGGGALKTNVVLRGVTYLMGSFLSSSFHYLLLLLIYRQTAIGERPDVIHCFLQYGCKLTCVRSQVCHLSRLLRPRSDEWDTGRQQVRQRLSVWRHRNACLHYMCDRA